MSRPERTAIVGTAFALSGAAALVYQVAWQRILALQTGVGIVSITVITAAFMLGLGVGNHWGGVLSRGLDPARALRLFAAVELLIGVFGASSVSLYYDGLYRNATAVYGHPAVGLSLHFAALLPPTILMGMSLPLLVSGTTAGGSRKDRTVDLLYALNTLGAAAGALATPALLLRHTSLRGAVAAAAIANGLAALAALVVGRRVGAVPSAQQGPAQTRYPPRSWLLYYALAGFVSLGLEMVWFRLTAVGVKATAFTFGAVLFVYLTGLGLGTLLGRVLPVVSRSPLRVFFLAQSFIAVFAALPVLALTRVSEDWPLLGWYVSYWGQRFHLLREHGWDTSALLRLYAVWPGLLFFVPTVLMGIAFCALQKAVANEGGTNGLRVGVLQAANIGGCVAGSLVVGLVLMNWVGATGTLRVLMSCTIVFALAGAIKDSPRLFLPIAGILAGLLAALPSQESLWRTLHGRRNARFMVKEDSTGVIGLSLEKNREWYVWIDGQSLSWLPFGGIHTLLGAIPALVHPAPRSIAVVGLGSGNTAWAAGCRREAAAVTVFELMRPQGALLRRLDAEERHARPPRLRRFLADRRIIVRWEDGRHALTHDAATYDIIEADALLPETAGSGNLYSVEFFELAARRLNPGGLMCSWAPTLHVKAAFAGVFSHVLAFPGDVLVGSLSPIAVDPPTWIARAKQADVGAYLGDRNQTATVLALARAEIARQPTMDVAPNRDLAPWDEFARRQRP